MFSIKRTAVPIKAEKPLSIGWFRYRPGENQRKARPTIDWLVIPLRFLPESEKMDHSSSTMRSTELTSNNPRNLGVLLSGNSNVHLRCCLFRRAWKSVLLEVEWLFVNSREATLFAAMRDEDHLSSVSWTKKSCLQRYIPHVAWLWHRRLLDCDIGVCLTLTSTFLWPKCAQQSSLARVPLSPRRSSGSARV